MYYYNIYIYIYTRKEGGQQQQQQQQQQQTTTTTTTIEQAPQIDKPPLGESNATGAKQATETHRARRLHNDPSLAAALDASSVSKIFCDTPPDNSTSDSATLPEFNFS